ncbi:MAG TPA: pyridoxal-phosphate dependent enzyme, partial [Alphaproteobacteria bacterium]|nr:pyridoxal-phosphate dependent enzyme [Alphaproteobacteria bacterium]
NPDIHSRTTAEEILSDFGANGLDYWVTGVGTGGTLKGVARVLKERSPNTQIITCEPDNSRLLAGGGGQTYMDDGSPAASHPDFRPHLMQGWSPDFIPKLANDVLEAGLVDRFLAIKGADAMKWSCDLAQREGIFCGITGGATFAGAIEVAKGAKEGAKILAMLPDTGERYLSTPLFEHIPESMTEEELEIAASTPRYRFDVSSALTPSQSEPDVPATPEAAAFVEEVTHDKAQPVVMFALEWCEFCWSLRKMFSQYGIAYRSVDLDSADYQENNWGGDIRVALRHKTGVPTIPQVFVGGEHIGGCTETLDAFNDGSLQKLLESSGVEFEHAKKADAYSFLPKWLHPR